MAQVAPPLELEDEDVVDDELVLVDEEALVDELALVDDEEALVDELALVDDEEALVDELALVDDEEALVCAAPPAPPPPRPVLEEAGVPPRPVLEEAGVPPRPVLEEAGVPPRPVLEEAVGVPPAPRPVLLVELLPLSPRTPGSVPWAQLAAIRAPVTAAEPRRSANRRRVRGEASMGALWCGVSRVSRCPASATPPRAAPHRAFTEPRGPPARAARWR